MVTINRPRGRPIGHAEFANSLRIPKVIDVTVEGLTFRCIVSKSPTVRRLDLATLISGTPATHKTRVATIAAWNRICRAITDELIAATGQHIALVTLGYLDLEGSLA